MAVVTISRLMGAAGNDIAREVAERLGYDIVDTGLIVKVAERAGVSVEKVRDYDEKFESRAVAFLKSFISPRTGKVLAGDIEHIDTKSFVEYTKTIIRGLAEEGNMIIVGRASQFILKDWELAFHVRIIADETFRINRIMERHDLSESNARDMIRKNDAMRTHYIERYFGGKWDDPFAYHLTVDSGKIGIPETVEIVTEAINKFSKSREYIPGVRDRRKGERRSSEERRKLDRRTFMESFGQKDIQRAIVTGRTIRAKVHSDRRDKERRTGKDRRNSPEE